MDLPNDLNFAAAARDYYVAVTGRTNWSRLSPPERDSWRSQLRRDAQALDAAVTREVLAHESKKPRQPG